MAKQTTWKCKRCGVSDTHKDDMEVEYVGEKKTPQRYHRHCYQEHLEEKVFKEQERKELDVLVEKIKEIYGVKTIPNSCYPYLQDLRNGTKFFGKYDYKYKEGYTYDLIAETFDYCSDTIEYWNGRKNFNGFTSALRYGLAIVCDKLSVVEQRRKDKERQDMLIDLHVASTGEESEEFVSSFKKKKKANTDITDFLD
jgi:hypothetical protein